MRILCMPGFSGGEIVCITPNPAPLDLKRRLTVGDTGWWWPWGLRQSRRRASPATERGGDFTGAW